MRKPLQAPIGHSPKDKEGWISIDSLKTVMILPSDTQNQDWVNIWPHSPESVPESPQRDRGSQSHHLHALSFLTLHRWRTRHCLSSLVHQHRLLSLPPISEDVNQTLRALWASSMPSLEYPTRPMDTLLYVSPCCSESFPSDGPPTHTRASRRVYLSGSRRPVTARGGGGECWVSPLIAAVAHVRLKRATKHLRDNTFTRLQWSIAQEDQSEARIIIRLLFPFTL